MPSMIPGGKPGRQVLRHRGYWLIVFQARTAGYEDPVLSFSAGSQDSAGTNMLSRAIRFPRPILGVVPGTGALGVFESATADIVAAAARPASPPDTTFTSDPVTATEGAATWACVWSEGDEWVDANVAIYYASYVGPMPVSFGACASRLAYTPDNV